MWATCDAQEGPLHVEEMDLEIENRRAAWYWAVGHGQVTRLVEGVEGIWLYSIPNDPGDVFGETVQPSYLSKRIGFYR